MCFRTQNRNLYHYMLVMEMCSLFNNFKMKHIIDAVWTSSVAKHLTRRKKNENNDPNDQIRLKLVKA